MDSSQLFNTHFVGRDGYNWWVGQIAPEETWKENQPGKPIDSNEDEKGFGERYRVRIMGYHTTEEIDDDALPWAMVQYPVTAGSGGRGSSQTANLTEGTFVTGFFIDGENGQAPVITGVIGFNNYQEVMKTLKVNNVRDRFVPSSGWADEDKIPYFNLRDGSGGMFLTQENATGNNVNDFIITSARNELKEKASKGNKEDGEREEALAETSECEPMPMNKIQTAMKNLVQDIEKLQKQVTDPLEALASDIQDITDEIKNLCKKAAKVIAGAIKWLLTQMEKFILEKINTQAKETYYLTQPGEERETLHEEMVKINDTIACLFKKIIDELLSMVEQMLEDALCGNQAVNIPQCYAENLVGGLIGQLLGMIDSTVNQAIGAISGLTGGSIGGLGGAGGAMGFIQELVSFLKCEEDAECAKVNEWSIWGGSGQSGKGSLQSIISKAQNIASSGGNIGGAPSLPDFSFSGINFDEIAGSTDNCNVGPRPCGPPQPRWYGGGGSGARGNLIISSLGEIMGYDMIDPGSGYGPSTKGKVYDDCGNGNGAVIYPIIEDGGIIDIVVTQPGSGYLPAPDGSEGGDGREWKDKEDTVVVKDPQDPTKPPTYPVPTPPGNVIEVLPGDKVTTPPGTNVVTSCGQEIRGGVETVITCQGSFTAPPIVDFDVRLPYPSSDDGAYPVILYLCDIIIADVGYNYRDSDKIVIVPDNGAKASVKYDRWGRVESVKVTESGEGFTQMPRVYIESDVGFNAELLPKLCIDRISNDDAKEPTFQDKVVTVIDCVGKV